MSQGKQDNSASAANSQRSVDIDDVVLEVLQRRLDGEVLPDDQVVAQYPELMPELGDELQLATELRACDGATDAVAAAGQKRTSGVLTVRCPHCRQRVELVAEASLTKIRCSCCGSQFSLAVDLAQTRDAGPSHQLGHFHLVERLGVGNFGTVWKARDCELDRMVAVKVPRRGELERGEMEYFLREARAAAQLNHPNIVSVHEIGRVGETVFIVSDVVSGLPLSEWFSQNQPSFREVAQLCAKIADALEYAHSSGVIHRDLKPHNVMIDADCEPYLMDFGLARRDAGEMTVTLDGHVLGTPAYMSPEQARGDSHQADSRSDVYSFGVILYELLTGELPFRGNCRMLIQQLLHEDVDSPRKLNRSVPKDLETICLKCLEKDPAKRYRHAQDAADELRRFLVGVPIQARSISRMDRAWRWCRRKPVAATLLLILMLVAVAGPLAAVNQRRLRQAANRRLVEANIHRAESLAGSGRPGQRLDGLKAIAESVPLAAELGLGEEVERRMRNAAITCMAYPDIVSANEWDIDTATVFHVDIDASFQHYAFQSYSGEPIKVLRIEDHQELNTVEVSGLLESLRLSRDGKLLAGVTGRVLSLWDAATGDLLGKHELVHPSAGYAFSRVSDRIAVATAAGPVRVLELPSLEVLYELPETAPVSCLGFGPSDEQLVVCRGTQESHADGKPKAEIYDLRDMSLAAEIPLASPAISASMSPQGLLAIVDLQGVTVFDVQLQQRITAFNPPLNHHIAAFDTTGDLLILGDPGNPLTTIWNARTGAPVLRFDAYMIGFKGNSLVYQKPGRLGLAQIVHADEYHGLASMLAPQPGTCHPGNHILAMPGYDLRIWDLAERRQLAIVPEFHTSALFTPDGHSLYTVASRGVHGVRRLYRWPYRQTDAESNKWKLGPPELVTLPKGFAEPHHLAMDNSGNILATDDNRHGKVMVLYLDDGRPPLVLDAPQAIFVAVSPDGHWLATGTWFGKYVTVYDLPAARQVRQFPVGRTRVAFTPDSRYLICGSGMRINLETWEQSSFPHQYDLQFEPPVFAVQGKMSVFSKRNFDATMLLFDTATWKPLGRLTSSSKTEVVSVCSRAVTRDGAKVVVATTTNPSQQRLDVWNLRAVRKQLAQINLDWELPSLDETPVPQRSIRVTVDVGELR